MSRTRPTITCAACGETKPHHSHGWCGTCYARWRAHGKPAGGPPPARTAPQCGTRQGWDRHMYRKEKACDPCRKAHADDVREWSHTSPRLRQRTEWGDQQSHVARTVAAHASDVDDCRALLEALGLVPPSAGRLPQRVGGEAA
jgi:hypothetical protein